MLTIFSTSHYWPVVDAPVLPRWRAFIREMSYVHARMCLTCKKLSYLELGLLQFHFMRIRRLKLVSRQLVSHISQRRL